MAKKIFMQTQTKLSKNIFLTQANTSARLYLTIAISMACSFSLIAQEASAKSYYKWVDQDGKTQYTETPPPAEAQKSATPAETKPRKDKKSLRDRVAAENDAEKKEDPHNKKSNSAPTEKTSEQKKIESQPISTPIKAISNTGNEQQKKETSYEELRTEFIKKSCEKAQQNLQSMTDHGRVKMMKENGEEHFLSAEEKNKKMAETNQFLDENCKTKGKKK